MAKVVMLIAHQGFRDEELFHTKEELERAGHEVKIASTNLKPAKGMISRLAEIDLLLNEIKENFDAIVFVGGIGSAQFFENPIAIQLAKKYYASNKVVAAICIAPCILANARVLNNKNATVYPSEDCIKTLLDNGANYTGKQLEISGKIVTANSPTTARDFGKAIASLL